VVVGDLRLAAHRIADFIYEKLTGERGVFSTRIAYVTKAGTASTCGWPTPTARTRSRPWPAPSRSSRRPGRPTAAARLRVVRVAQAGGLRARRRHGKRRLIANFRGSNSAPAWSPDGRTLAVTLSRDGGSQLYTIDANGGEPRA
jgi:TolB protein